MRTTRAALAAAAGAVALLGLCVTPAAADPPQPPRHITGKVIPGGADGRPHELFCPAPFHAYSGGFTLKARKGARFLKEAADLLESRPNDTATGWIVTVRKGQVLPSPHHHRAHPRIEPADLVVHVVCTQDLPTHGM
ncbi:hypothetical protein [Streptomyces sp. NPDC053367]|uniref:hypothetical protein n=1 Tax=Streptomyces sp. NPDC053367 TaxID=3365700 RepID=UPI0037D75D39